MKKKDDAPQIQRLSMVSSQEFIPTGSAELDGLLGGGLARGRILELFGQPGTGKTHLVTQLVAQATTSNYRVLYVDSEFALSGARTADLGVDNTKVDYIADSNLERVTELLIASVGKYDIIVLDSLAELIPLTVDTQQVGETAIGLFAREIKHWVVKFRPRLGTSKTAFIATNQYRSPVGMYARVESPGGKAWHHCVDMQLYLQANKGDILPDKSGHHVTATLTKSRLSAPHQSIKLTIRY